MAEIVLPNDANPLGNMLGGKVMHLIDIAASMSAMRLCRKPVVTVSVDSLDFRYPIKVGHMILLKASVNYTHRTSMEVGVRVESENPLTGKRYHTSSAYLTFVALDEQGKPTEVPAVVPETEEEKERFKAAELRRAYRMENLLKEKKEKEN
ncbi:MAG: acyl-CoA thioesterase [Candidatus Marinimicrobia bacterium]|nr:acyl-CoA thioesterase [Candidatus Neomarinimicrobiota bacterium]